MKNSCTANFKRVIVGVWSLSALLFVACNNGKTPEQPDTISSGVYVLCEGNYMFGNATLTAYDPSSGTQVNGAFASANGIALGDVVQSMCIYNKTGYIVVNNSGVVFAVDPATLEVKGSITSLVSPRHFMVVSDTKAYISDLRAAAITVVNPRTYKKSGSIPTVGHPSTEQMLRVGSTIYAACASSDNKILIIDPTVDAVVDSIEVGLQPVSMVLDKDGKVWCLCDGGGWEGNPAGYEAPRLMVIDPDSRAVERTFTFALGDYVSKMTIDAAGERIYYLHGGVRRMNITDTRPPAEPIISIEGYGLYGVGVDPANSDIYVADAVDYTQSGKVYRYDADLNPVDTLTVGINPCGFCFNE